MVEFHDTDILVETGRQCRLLESLAASAQTTSRGLFFGSYSNDIWKSVLVGIKSLKVSEGIMLGIEEQRGNARTLYAMMKKRLKTPQLIRTEMHQELFPGSIKSESAELEPLTTATNL